MAPTRLRFNQMGVVAAAAVLIAAVLITRAGWAQDWPGAVTASSDGQKTYAGKTPYGWTDPLDHRRRPQRAASESEGDTDSLEGLDGFLSEFRLGTLDHDFGLFGNQREEGLDLNMEVLFVAPAFLEVIWSPRPHFGVTVNTEGNTSFLYAGVTWDIADILDRAFGWKIWEPLLIEGALGLNVHNGQLSVPEEAPAKALGCRVLFREALSVGVRFWTHHSLSLSLDHISNASLCDDNHGLETLGVRYGYRF